jgi:hypothetical protein
VEELGLFTSLHDKMNYLSDVHVLAEEPDWSWRGALASFSLTGTGTEGRQPSLFPWPLWCGVGAAAVPPLT